MASSRRSLVQRQAESGVRDPFAYANSQLRELESTTLKSRAKRHAKEEQAAKARLQLAQVDQQLALINGRYAALCSHLESAKASREALARAVEEGKKDSSLILSATKDSIRLQNFHIARLSRSQALLELQQERGYDLGPTSTYRQQSMSSFAAP
jgi:small-conductance mechanosensitive channel